MREVIFLCVVILAFASGEDLEVKYCDDVGGEHCTIEAVRVTPCSTPKRECKIKRGNTASIEFDFTPKFAADSLESVAAWVSSTGTLPFMGMDHDGCKSTKCPLVSGQSQSFTYTLPIGKKLPAGRYPLIWTLSDQNNPSNKCCFKFTIRLT